MCELPVLFACYRQSVEIGPIRLVHGMPINCVVLVTKLKVTTMCHNVKCPNSNIQEGMAVPYCLKDVPEVKWLTKSSHYYKCIPNAFHACMNKVVVLLLSFAA